MIRDATRRSLEACLNNESLPEWWKVPPPWAAQAWAVAGPIEFEARAEDDPLASAIADLR
jgi:hypothetical protein